MRTTVLNCETVGVPDLTKVPPLLSEGSMFPLTVGNNPPLAPESRRDGPMGPLA